MSTNPLTRPIWRWVRLLASPIGGAALTSAAGLVASVLLYRLLPDADAGAFALLTALIQIGIILGGLGQTTLTQRVYSRAEPGLYRWNRDLLHQFLLTSPAMLILAIAMGRLYQLSVAQTLFVLAGAMLGSLVTTSAGMLASNRHYGIAASLPRLPNGLLLVPVVIAMALPSAAGLPAVLVGFLVAAGVSLAIGWLSLNRLHEPGSRTIDLRQRGYGLAFLASQFATLVPDYLLLAAAAFFATPEDLALFAALQLLFRPTQLLQNVLAQVLTTELTRSSRPPARRLMLAFALATGLILVGGVLLAGPAVNLLYGGRYSPTLALIAFVALASGLDILETLPRSYLVGRGSRQLLVWFGASQITIAIAGLLVGLALVGEYGVAGAAAGAALIFLARNVASFAVFAGVRIQERRRNSAL